MEDPTNSSKHSQTLASKAWTTARQMQSSLPEIDSDANAQAAALSNKVSLRRSLQNLYSKTVVACNAQCPHSVQGVSDHV